MSMSFFIIICCNIGCTDTEAITKVNNSIMFQCKWYNLGYTFDIKVQ